MYPIQSTPGFAAHRHASAGSAAAPAQPAANPFNVASALWDYETGSLDFDQVVELFQHLVDSGIAWSLQGSYGRTAAALIEAGHVQARRCHDPHRLGLHLEACATCHTGVKTVEDLAEVRMPGSLMDYDGDGDEEEGVASEMAGLQEKLLASIKAYAKEVAKNGNITVSPIVIRSDRTEDTDRTRLLLDGVL